MKPVQEPVARATWLSERRQIQHKCLSLLVDTRAKPAAAQRQRAEPSSWLAHSPRPAGPETRVAETVSHSFGSLFVCTCCCLGLQMQSEVWMGEYFCHPKVDRLRDPHLQLAVSNWPEKSFLKNVWLTIPDFTNSMLCKELLYYTLTHTKPIRSAPDWNKRQAWCTTHSGKLLTLAQISNSIEVGFLVWVKEHTIQPQLLLLF